MRRLLGILVPACICLCVQAGHASNSVPALLPPAYTINSTTSALGISINCNARPMLTYDGARIWRATLDLTAEIRPNPFGVTAAGVAVLGDVGGSDRYYIGPYWQYSFEKERFEGGICLGMRF
jgi:hypothetical protein